MRRNILKNSTLILLLLLVACALPPRQDSPEVIRQQLQEQLIALPGAVISDDGLQVSYPDESLFAAGAVLPLPGGMEVLDPLVDLLLQNSQVRGVGTVRSTGHSAEYDLLLATRRVEFLLQIFRNRGLAGDRLQLTPEVGPGVPLELQLQSIISDNSAGAKQ